MPTDTKLDKLIINKLTLDQYASIETPDEGQLYFVDNEEDGFPSQSSAVANYALLANGDGTTKWGDVALPSVSHTWSADQTYTANIAVQTGKSIACDTFNSKATGNSLLRMYYDTDSAYKCLVGSVYRQTTILGSTDRPYYAKDGEGFQAHELALVEETPQLGVDITDTSGIVIREGTSVSTNISIEHFHAYQIGKLVFVHIGLQFASTTAEDKTVQIVLSSMPSTSSYCSLVYGGANGVFYGQYISSTMWASVPSGAKGTYECQFFYTAN